MKDLGEEGGAAYYKSGIFTEELYRIHDMHPENVSQLGVTPQTHEIKAIGGTLRRARTNTLQMPVPNGAGGYRLNRLELQ